MFGRINAIEYGFNGDGITKNDAVMKKYIENDYTTPIFFPTGSYVFAEGFNFPDQCYIELEANAELKLDGDEIQEYFITLRRGRTGGGYTFNSFIRGGFINANNKAKNGIGVYKTRHCVFENFILKNVLEKGIVTRTEKIPDGHAFFRNILVENDFGIKGTTGIFDNAFDTHFEEVEVVNFETGFYTICGRFCRCSAWLRDNSIVENSTFAFIDGYDIVFESPAVDTYRYGFRIDRPGYSVGISNMLWITNGGVYTKELRDKFDATIFNAASDECIYNVCGLKINHEENLSFSNIPLPSSSFLNLRYPKTFNPYEEYKNFRDDTEALKKNM